MKYKSKCLSHLNPTVKKVIDFKKKSAPILCVECGYEFRKIIRPSTFEIRCPKCHGYDTEIGVTYYMTGRN